MSSKLDAYYPAKNSCKCAKCGNQRSHQRHEICSKPLPLGKMNQEYDMTSYFGLTNCPLLCKMSSDH